MCPYGNNLKQVFVNPKKRDMKSIVKKISIEDQVNLVFKSLTEKADPETVVMKAKPVKGNPFGKRVISIFDRAEINRQELDSSYKPIPRRIYAFYPNSIDPTRLGSVAIYCDNAIHFGAVIRKKQSLFGLRVTSVEIEHGLHTFVDVRFVV